MRIRLCRHRPSSSTAAEQLARWTNFSRACSVEPGVEQPAQSNGRQGFRFRVDGTCGTEPSGLLWVDLIVPETTFGTPKCIKTVQAVGPWIPFQMSSIYIYIYIYIGNQSGNGGNTSQSKLTYGSSMPLFHSSHPRSHTKSLSTPDERACEQL